MESATLTESPGRDPGRGQGPEEERDLVRLEHRDRRRVDRARLQPRRHARVHRRRRRPGLQSPAVILVAFFPMAFIAAAYYYMNRADPDCGTTFSWVTRAMGPWLGWQGGWAIVVADVLVMPSLADDRRQLHLPAVRQQRPDDVRGRRVVGIAWIIVMTAICYIGIELSARTQQVLLGDGVHHADGVRGRRADQGLRQPPAALDHSRRCRGSTRSTSRASARSTAASCSRSSSTGAGTPA